MKTTVVMRNAENQRVEIFADKDQTYGRCRGKGNYIVIRTDRKFYRIESMVEEYKYWKANGFRMATIY